MCKSVWPWLSCAVLGCVCADAAVCKRATFGCDLSFLSGKIPGFRIALLLPPCAGREKIRGVQIKLSLK